MEDEEGYSKSEYYSNIAKITYYLEEISKSLIAINKNMFEKLGDIDRAIQLS